MSGIFKGDSIYKSGGGAGGGGYHDGGQIEDADFMQVENNSISSYNNLSRNEINYYFEIQEGEIINAIVELTTSVNATIYVYVLQNGFYIPLGNIGGDTVTAGNDYNINITGNSFSIEQVTNLDEDATVLIGVNKYKARLYKSIGLAFLTENVREVLDESRFYYAYNNDPDNVLNGYGLLYDLGGFYQGNGTPKSVSWINNGWRIPTIQDFNKLKNVCDWSQAANIAKVKSTYGWSGTNGNNESGFNFIPTGYAEGAYPSHYPLYRGSQTRLLTSTLASYEQFLIVFCDENTAYQTSMRNMDDMTANRFYGSIRLVKDI